MAQTFRDFLAECEMYPYSREAFEIQKLSDECALMESYIESYKFALSDYPYAESVILPEHYFIETTDADIELIQEELDQKHDELAKKIWDKILHAITAVARFLMRCLNVFSSGVVTIKKCIPRLKRLTITNEMIEDWNKTADVLDKNGEYVNNMYFDKDDLVSIAGIYPTDWVPGNAQPFARTLNLKFAPDVENNPNDAKSQRSKFISSMCVLLSTDVLVIDGGDRKSEYTNRNLIGATDAKTVIKNVKAVLKGNDPLDPSMKMINGLFEIDTLFNDSPDSDWFPDEADNKKKYRYFAISANPAKIKKASDQLQKVIDKLQEMQSHEEKLANRSSMQTILDMADLTVKIYRSILNYRQKGLPLLDQWLTKIESGKPTEKKPEEAPQPAQNDQKLDDRIKDFDNGDKVDDEFEDEFE